MRKICFIIIVLVHCSAETQTVDPEAIVNVRIEGDENTIFEAFILSTVKTITTSSGGTHRCDGTNNNASAIPVPTMTSSLDIAGSQEGFTWDGTYSTLYDDYTIVRIGNTSQTSSKFWSTFVDYEFTQVGGCQQKVKHGQHLLFAFDGYNKAHFLKLETSNSIIQIGDSLTVLVTDGRTGEPIHSATVGGMLTNATGHAQVTFKNLGAQRLKAERPDSIRSNTLVITVTA
ncbi:unnamed protein product [Adineta ricciae]|uniref:Uncharacterized protein n=1 Tax=Adineta ricciae TaxID=249248 RepID=A0A814UEK3_ADIRI|nr:unnamed protein product [Adineta ricciae]CAF1180293.1 unnamed protein product [Adineta ricciae]